MIATRRSFLLGLVAAPAIVRASSLMSVHSPLLTMEEVVAACPIPLSHWYHADYALGPGRGDLYEVIGRPSWAPVSRVRKIASAVVLPSLPKGLRAQGTVSGGARKSSALYRLASA